VTAGVILGDSSRRPNYAEALRRGEIREGEVGSEDLSRRPEKALLRYATENDRSVNAVRISGDVFSRDAALEGGEIGLVDVIVVVERSVVKEVACLVTNPVGHGPQLPPK
jgi:hypothetical protein